MKTALISSLAWDILVRPRDRVVCSHMTSEPVALLRALGAAAAQSAPDRQSFSIYLGVPFSDAADLFPPQTEFITFGGMGTAGALARRHRTHVSLTPYRLCGDAFGSGAQRADVALVSLARSADGSLTLGAAHGYIVDAARRARVVIAEINAQAPAVPGAPWPDDIPIDTAVEVSYPLANAPAARSSELEQAIAGHVAPLIADGACLQVGIGALPSAVLAQLAHHRALGLHSGMLTPPLWQLIESGTIDNSRKRQAAGISTIGCAYGDAVLYAAVHDRATLQLREPRYTHGGEVIAGLDDFVALNSAIEVDLFGQANAETVPGRNGELRYVGGVGGLNDFIRAARLAPRGQAVIALPSRQPDGRPRIVARLGGPATVAASDADIVVTEHGVARLRDASLDQRARRLIAIADPADRDGLNLAARSMGLLA
jgi:acyl-CoA hydrolase